MTRRRVEEFTQALQSAVRPPDIVPPPAPTVQAGQLEFDDVDDLLPPETGPPPTRKEEKKVEPPRYHVNMRMVGIAPTDVEVSRYISALNTYRLLKDVNLVSSEEHKFEGEKMRQFEIMMTLNPKADVRDAAPTMKHNELSDPMTDEMRITPGSTAAVGPHSREGG